MRPIYLLDTNVISELARPRPNRDVEKSFFRHMNVSAIPVVAWGECLYGLKKATNSTTNERLADFYYNNILENFSFLPFDEHAASIYSDIKSRLMAIGNPAPELDMQIAATAIANNAILVTRNVKDFQNIEEVSALMLENWFDEP